MHLNNTRIDGLLIAETRSVRDHRGAFSRLFCEMDLAPAIGNRRIVQINHSLTCTVGALRGMHFQHAPHAEMKMVRCLKGRVWDAVVDLRYGSPTFLQWVAQELTPENALMMVIPEGCAHGFQILEENSELLYLHTAPYTPEAEGGVRYDDPAIEIDWPMPAVDLSERDMHHPLIKHPFQGIKL